MPRTAAEEKFIHEYTRQLLIGWSVTQIYDGSLDVNPEGGDRVYLDHAVEKGWISKDMSRVLAAGFTTAAGQLKR